MCMVFCNFILYTLKADVAWHMRQYMHLKYGYKAMFQLFVLIYYIYNYYTFAHRVLL